MFRYFNIRSFEIPEYRSFYIWSFYILYPTRFFQSNVWLCRSYLKKNSSSFFPIKVHRCRDNNNCILLN